MPLVAYRGSKKLNIMHSLGCSVGQQEECGKQDIIEKTRESIGTSKWEDRRPAWSRKQHGNGVFRKRTKRKVNGQAD